MKSAIDVDIIQYKPAPQRVLTPLHEIGSPEGKEAASIKELQNYFCFGLELEK